MNGRVYDTITGRFTSADPYIQAPVNFTDPSGYLLSGWGHAWHKVKNGASTKATHVKHWAEDHNKVVGVLVVVVGAYIAIGETVSTWQFSVGSAIMGLGVDIINWDDNKHAGIEIQLQIGC